MYYLSGAEADEALEYLKKAAKIAENATCDRAKCGTVIVKAAKIIGRGFNSPPNNLASQKRCSLEKDGYNKKVTDKTCCIHAEQRAIMDALVKSPQQISGSRLYFVRLDENNQPTRSGQPYCTICSKMSLDSGIAEFVLWHEQGICVYDTAEYNDLSYKFNITK